MAPTAVHVHHRFLRYRPSPGVQSVVGLVNNNETSVSAILNPATGKAYIELFDIIEDHPQLPANHSFQLVAGSERELSKVEKLAPLTGRDIMCIGKNYVEHAKEFNKSGFDASDKNDQPEFPVFFTKRASCIVPDGHPIYPHSSVTSSLDYEGELGIIVGKGGIGIKKKDAWKHVWGAVIINDIVEVTARERQRDHKQFYIGKSLDTFCPMGAFVVPSSSLAYSDLHLTTKVNGETRQSQNTSELIFDVPTLIETASMGMTIQPGDVIATGTPFGVGMGMNPKTWLKEGDMVEISIPPLGVLRSPVASPAAPPFSTAPVRMRPTSSITSRCDANWIFVGSPAKALHVEVSGPDDGPPVLFIHGCGSSLQFFKAAIELAGLEKTHRIVLYDLEGHGQSPLSSNGQQGLSIAQFADDAKALLDLLGIKKAHLVGHSLGGLIVNTFAVRYPDVVQNIVLVAAATTFDAAGKQGLRDRAAAVRSSGMTPIADTMTSVGLSARTLSSNPVAKLFVRQSLTTTPPEGYALASLAIAAAPEPDYSLIQAKNVVILAGREDKRIPEVTTRFFESSIKGAKVVWLENVGHWLAVEDVESTAKALSESL